MDNPQIDAILKDVRAKIDNALTGPSYIHMEVDSSSYYYDSTTGTVLKGTFRNIWKKIAQKSIIDLVLHNKPYSPPPQPIKIREPYDEDSIVLLYGPIVEVKDET